MARTEEFQLRPMGWETDPAEERIRLSTFDYLAAAVYNSYALYFRLEETDRPKVLEALKGSLERTLSQCRQLVGRLEKNHDDDDHSFVKRRDDTVRLVVTYWDETDGVPSFSDVEQAQYCSSVLGDVSRFVVPGMEYGERPECMLDARPVISAFKINFIPGGMILLFNWHHYANDAAGFGHFTKQLADNCFAAYNGTATPSWDLANLDASRFTANDLASHSKVDGPKSPEKHPDVKKHSLILLHLPKSKAAKLKALATPTKPGWISTYDAFAAFLWRCLTRHRMVLYDAQLEDVPLFIEGINLRPRAEPAVAARQQRNLFWAAFSAHLPEPLTLGDITACGEGAVPLSVLATKVREMTNSINQTAIDNTLAMLAPIRNKASLYSRADSCPPLTFALTDWRCADVCPCDFGFGRPTAYRHLADTVSEHLCIIYPPRAASTTENAADEGCEFAVAVEVEAVPSVLGDQELMDFFEFRGFEVDGK
ncbi:hypothetical protein CC79DRAFT_1327605 [Sarocladium strictum]